MPPGTQRHVHQKARDGACGRLPQQARDFLGQNGDVYGRSPSGSVMASNTLRVSTRGAAPAGRRAGRPGRVGAAVARGSVAVTTSPPRRRGSSRRRRPPAESSYCAATPALGGPDLEAPEDADAGGSLVDPGGSRNRAGMTTLPAASRVNSSTNSKKSRCSSRSVAPSPAGSGMASVPNRSASLAKPSSLKIHRHFLGALHAEHPGRTTFVVAVQRSVELLGETCGPWDRRGARTCRGSAWGEGSSK